MVLSTVSEGKELSHEELLDIEKRCRRSREEVIAVLLKHISVVQSIVTLLREAPPQVHPEDCDDDDITESQDSNGEGNTVVSN